MISSIKFFLKYFAAICCFISGKRISYFLLGSIMFLSARSAVAFFSDGKIDDDLSYRSLRVEMPKTNQRGCYLEGEIINNTNMAQEGVAITFYAYDFFDHSLWKETIHIDIIDRFYSSGKGRHFRKKLRSCDMPAKFQFKVTGVKGKDAKKIVKEKPGTKHKYKPKSKDFESMDNRPKSDTGAVDIITTPAVPIQKYVIILTNGKKITAESCREEGNMVFLNKDGGEFRISKEKISEIRKPN